jgi:hypothetical protein
MRMGSTHQGSMVNSKACEVVGHMVNGNNGVTLCCVGHAVLCLQLC